MHVQWEHFALLATFIKLQFVIKIFVLPIFEWPLKTGFTVYAISTTISRDGPNGNIIALTFNTNIFNKHVFQ